MGVEDGPPNKARPTSSPSPLVLPSVPGEQVVVYVSPLIKKLDRACVSS